MAKNNYYNKGNTKRGGTASARRDNAFVWKIVSLVLAIILMAFTVLAVFELATPYKPSHGFKPQAQMPATPNEGGETENFLPPIDENGEELKTDGTAQAMPTSMTFRSVRALSEPSENGVSPQSGTSVTLTAMIEPADADNTKVDWTVKYEDGSTAGALAYIQVSPASDGALTATVTNYAAFSKKIIITVTSRDNPSISASCTCDYLATVSRVDVSLTNGGTVNKIVIGDNKTYTVSATPVWGVGTIRPEVSIAYGSEIGMDGEATDPSTNFHYAIVNNGFPMTAKNVFADKNSFVCTSDFPTQLAGSIIVMPPIDQTPTYLNAFKKAVAACTGGNHFYATATATTTYKGEEVGSVTGRKGYKFDAAAMKTSVTGLTLNGGDLMFGV